MYCVDEDCYRSDVQPQSALGAQDSPSRTRSSDHEVETQALVGDVGTSAPPPVNEAGTQGSVGDVGVSSSPPITDVDPINSMPGTSAQGPTADPIQIELPRENPETTGVQASGPTSTGLSLGREDIDWTGMP
jgi:hypothetical protein